MLEPLLLLALAGPALAQTVTCDDLMPAVAYGLLEFRASCGKGLALRAQAADKDGAQPSPKSLADLYPQGFLKSRVDEVLQTADGKTPRYQAPAQRPKPRKAKAKAKEEAEPAPERVPLNEKILLKAIADIAEMMKKGSITAKCVDDPRISAQWSHEPNCSEPVCGAMEFGSTKLKHLQYGRNSDNVSTLLAQDQLGNSTLHELSHVFVSYFDNVYGETPKNNPSQLTGQFAYLRFWNGKTQKDYTGTFQMNQYKLPTFGYNPERLGNEEAARWIAHNFQLACKGSVARTLRLGD